MGSSCICPTNRSLLAPARTGRREASSRHKVLVKARRVPVAERFLVAPPSVGGRFPDRPRQGPRRKPVMGGIVSDFTGHVNPISGPSMTYKGGQMLYRAVAQRRQAPRRHGGRLRTGIRGRNMRPRPPGRLALPPARWAPYAPTPRPPGALGPRGRSGGGHRGASSDSGQERTQQRLELDRAFLLRRVAAVGQDFEATAGNTGL